METTAPRAKYSTRFLANLGLAIVVATAAWLWFNIHLRPHVDDRLFGGVTIGAVLLFAYGIFKSFVGDDAKNAVQKAIDLRPTTYVLLAAIPLLVIAYLTTFSVYLVAATAPDDSHPLKFRVTTPGGKTRSVELTKSRPEAALTFPLTIRGVKLSIDTDSPPGFSRQDVLVTRRYAELKVPDPGSFVPRRLLRLVPGLNLMRLSNKADPGYHLTIYRNDQPLYDQAYLKFEALYVGGNVEGFRNDLSGLNGDAGYARELREYLLNIGAPAEKVPALVDRYINHSRPVGTAVLHDSDRVRVLLRSTAGVPMVDESFLIMPQEVRTVFLKGVPE